jgi:lipopolysaccharide export system protein LptA
MSSCGRNQYVRLLKSCARMLSLFLILPAVLAHALPEDNDQPMHITADKALRDDIKGVTIYSGNVVLTQGSLELKADILTINQTNGELDEIIAEGRPAKMHQQPDVDKAIVYGHAKVIRYFKAEDRVHMQTDAHMEQDGAVVDGDSIEYLIAKQLITAESDQTKPGNPPVVVVIPPNVQKKEGGSGATKSK